MTLNRCTLDSQHRSRKKEEKRNLKKTIWKTGVTTLQDFPGLPQDFRLVLTQPRVTQDDFCGRLLQHQKWDGFLMTYSNMHLNGTNAELDVISTERFADYWLDLVMIRDESLLKLNLMAEAPCDKAPGWPKVDEGCNKHRYTRDSKVHNSSQRLKSNWWIMEKTYHESRWMVGTCIPYIHFTTAVQPPLGQPPLLKGRGMFPKLHGFSSWFCSRSVLWLAEVMGKMLALHLYLNFTVHDEPPGSYLEKQALVPATGRHKGSKLQS